LPITFEFVAVEEAELKFDDVTVDSLKAEKGFSKVGRKQQKDLEALKKRHHKEMAAVQKQQVAAIEKLVKGKK
jgi:phosphatidylinositol phospholipase C, beta